MRLGADEPREIVINCWSDSEVMMGLIDCEDKLHEAEVFGRIFDWRESGKVTIECCVFSWKGSNGNRDTCCTNADYCKDSLMRALHTASCCS